MVESKTRVKYSIRKLGRFQETSKEIIETLIEINRAAFEGDPFIRLLVGGHPELEPILHRAFTNDFLNGGLVYVVELEEDETRRIVGSAMWVGPGNGESLLKEESKDDGGSEEEEGFNKFMEALEETDSGAARWWKEYYFEKYASFTNACLDGPSIKKEDGWRLQVIGVLPEFQGCGIGRALIDVVEKEISSGPNATQGARRLSLETESESARAFYHRIGFAELGETIIEGVGELGGCTMWCLAKEV